MGTVRDIMNEYSITFEQFKDLDMSFLQNEGWTENGHECETFGDWLDYHCKKPKVGLNAGIEADEK